MSSERDSSTATLLVTCPDRKGIVAALAQILYGHGANILDSDQHSDPVAGQFFQRIRFDRAEMHTDRTTLESSIAEHEAMELRLADQVAQLERRVGEISEQRHLMRTRQSTAEAMRALRTMDCSDIDVDDTFERWNVSITEAELEAGSADMMVPVDRLEKRFRDDETRAELESELDALCTPEEGSDNAR